ncbi:MAG: VirB3 family type IV secretion system protein [Proteobacteria bacterium]|nr:VirB3 family type IV secretion system protein [Pseudomonadota bacterium]MBU1586283.1 VirB3 family type IV secretion system protein [Pseudomonadota bacterium]MBU2453179.1 VirB3 family type IV secretion system protein [Pseudomonadota bacterium]MBU2630790.1 VirB3 family type IV secretion system protein [Pseudomonadota bacterium]
MRRIRIARALTRPALIAGCERVPLIALGMICTVMAITISIYLILLAIGVAFIGVGILRRMAKKDPIMVTIYLRHIKLRKLYMSKPSIYRFL